MALPALGDNYVLRVATTMLMYSALALGWNFIGGFAGYPSFATAAFFGLGAYAGGVLQSKGVPMLRGLGHRGAHCRAVCGSLGRAILHLRGHYFAIASLVVAEVLREITNSATDLTGGGMGLNLPVLSMDVTSQTRLFYYAMIVVAAAALATRHSSTAIGWASACAAFSRTRTPPIVLGVNARRYKVLAFVLSAVFPGLCGGIYASWVNYIDPIDVYDVLLSVKPHRHGAARRRRHHIGRGLSAPSCFCCWRSCSGAICSSSMPGCSGSLSCSWSCFSRWGCAASIGRRCFARWASGRRNRAHDRHAGRSGASRGASAA